MPDMDGWEVLKLLKADEDIANIPVAMLTARTEMKDKIQGLQEGAIDYICKPFATRELLEKLNVIFAQVKNKSPDLKAATLVRLPGISG